ncbi:MAG: hypothetical protein PWR10_2432 [Halanaerobiales bacterium]|nr:hypothetical protein [Halanaerobiales bacterium]
MEAISESKKTEKNMALDAELLFTETYKMYKNAPKAVRELECLKVQLPTILGPMSEKNLISGRIDVKQQIK